MLANSRKIIATSILFLFGCLFLAQDWWFISDWDDVFYKFIVERPDEGHVPQLIHGQHRYIQSFFDIIYSQYNHYIGTNGRYIVHCIVQACTSFLTHHQFAIINSIAFILLLWGMVKLSDDRMRVRNTLYVGVALAVLSPLTMGDFFCNISWAVNYLWSVAATVWWLFLYEKVKKSKELSKWCVAIIFFISVIAGSLQEGFCVGVSVGFAVYYLWNIKKLTWRETIMVGGYVIGSCICMFSPANFGKTEGAEKGLSVDAILDVLMSYSIVSFCILFVVGILISWNKMCEFVKKNTVMIVAFALTLVFCLFFIYHGSRQYTLSTILSIIMTIRFVEFFDSKTIKWIQWAIIGMGLCLIMIYYPKMYSLRKELGQAYYSIVEEEMKTKSKIVYIQPYEEARYKIEQSGLKNFFVINFINGAPESGYLSIDVSEGADMNYITAVLPLSLEEMRIKCETTNNKDGVACLYNHIYACSFDDDYLAEDVTWYYKTTFRNPNKWHDFSSTARYRLPYKGKYYYVFNTGTSNIQGENVRIKMKK